MVKGNLVEIGEGNSFLESKNRMLPLQTLKKSSGGVFCSDKNAGGALFLN